MTALPGPWAYTLAAIAGAGGWVLISLVSGRREAWDSELYFSWFLPALVVLVAVLGFLTPARPWRWGLVPFVAQAVILVAQNPSANLLPLGVIVLLVLGVSYIVPAWCGAAFRRWWERRSTTSA